MTNAIELSHISKRFDSFAIQDLSLRVPNGTICGLVGENGAGKSTTIRLLMGALRPDSGQARVLGVDAASPEFRQVKEDIGVVLDEAYFPESLNALQVGRIMSKTYRRWDESAYGAFLRRFELRPEDCLLIGNDMEEDRVPAESLGIQTFLITDCLINPQNRPVLAPCGTAEEALAFLKTL